MASHLRNVSVSDVLAQIIQNEMTGNQTASSKSTDTQPARPTNSATTDTQTRDYKTVLTMPADIKVSSISDTSGASFFHDDVRPTSVTSFSQIQSLQDIATTPVNTETNRQSLSNNTQSLPQTKTEATPALLPIPLRMFRFSRRSCPQIH